MLVIQGKCIIYNAPVIKYNDVEQINETSKALEKEMSQIFGVQIGQ